MKAIDCIRCGFKHENEWGWKYKAWQTEKGSVLGWACMEEGRVSYPEFTTKAIKEGRQQFASDQVQSHRNGALTREYVELYPGRVKAMVKEGSLSKSDVAKSKYSWPELKGWDRNKKTDKSVVIK